MRAFKDGHAGTSGGGTPTSSLARNIDVQQFKSMTRMSVDRLRAVQHPVLNVALRKLTDRAETGPIGIGDKSTQPLLALASAVEP